jgi:hypothetical protein
VLPTAVRPLEAPSRSLLSICEVIVHLASHPRREPCETPRENRSRLFFRMGSRGRGTVRRLLDPQNASATLVSMVKAAGALDVQLQVRLVRKPTKKRRAA